MITIELFYFLMGYAAACFLIPILSTLSEVILTALELWKSYLNFPLVKNNEIINDDSPVHHQIGFHFTKEEEEYEDEEAI